MDFTISDEMKMVTEAVGRFVREKVQPLETVTEETGQIPPEALAALKAEAQALGFYALNMSEAAGGGGLGVLDMCLVEEQLGQTSDALIRRIFGQVYPMLDALSR